MKQSIAIIGDGGWGTALAILLTGNGHKVTVWGHLPGCIETIRARHENELYLPGVKLPPQIAWTSDPAEAVAGAQTVVLAVPTRFMRQVLTSFAGLLPADSDIVSVAKGLDSVTHMRMTQVAEEVLKRSPVAALSGPSHAEEVSRGIPTAVCVASTDETYSQRLQKLFSDNRFRVYTLDDVVGVELGGALKNVIAIAVGVSDGIGFGDNTRAALITRGLAEITRLGCALGGRQTTFAGLSGMGDLIVTCTSRHSRNRAVGERLGKGESLDHIVSTMKQVAEGVWNCAVVREIARDKKIAVPITEEVHAIIAEGKNPRDAVAALMSRDLRPEA